MESSGQREPDAARLAGAKLLVLDVDGVLTDGRISVDPGGSGDEQLAFDVQDGIALKWIQAAGLVVAWISGRGPPAVFLRARELGIVEIHLKATSKRETLTRIQDRLGIAPPETVGMGDDLPDLGLRARCGFFAAPANARPEIRACADLVTEGRGGRGAVRELCERILRAQGRWPSIVDAASR